ncbi:GTP-binding protein [Streptomyces canus]|uniref:GTP-binding protein n=1 Tax=Streptomyces canus TaxID=58343 RepID=UPI0030DE9C8D
MSAPRSAGAVTEPAPDQHDTLRIAFVGAVDHGKSTLLGRLLYDLGAISEDRLQTSIEDGGLAFLLDGLSEERAHLFTLDTAQAVVDTPARRYVFIDVPGHVELLKNMVTGASRADLGVVVLAADVAKAVEQTRRHLRVLELLGVTTVVCAVTKMDMAGYDSEVFGAIAAHVAELAAECGLELAAAVPVSAVEGRNITSGPTAELSWYEGSCLMGTLDGLSVRRGTSALPRFVVQAMVGGPGGRRAAGRVESGTIRLGQVLTDGTGPGWTVRAIERFGEPALAEARAGDSVGLDLDGAEAAPGTVLAPPDQQPARGRIWRTRVLSTAAAPIVEGAPCTVRYAVTAVAARVEHIGRRWNSATMAELGRSEAVRNTEFAEVRLALLSPAAADDIRSCAPLGRFMLCDDQGRALALGVIDHVTDQEEPQ